jgi:hypothetical protein
VICDHLLRENAYQHVKLMNMEQLVILVSPQTVKLVMVTPMINAFHVSMDMISPIMVRVVLVFVEMV